MRDLLIRDYVKLKSRLVRRLGSTDAATEVLHEVYLRLGVSDSAATIHNPDAYLYRAALNVAADSREADRRWVDKVSIEALRHRDDHELDPEEIVLARQEWKALLVALEQLPARRRAIFLAARLEELRHREIASRFGISIDTVDRELKQAFEFLAERFGKSLTSRRGNRSREPS
ncbi:MAG: RNA polymerase sigma factor [Rhodoplanes sp.]|nr:RNA polymerase sigma factor [Rhodoplanes sp.]